MIVDGWAGTITADHQAETCLLMAGQAPCQVGTITADGQAGMTANGQTTPAENETVSILFTLVQADNESVSKISPARFHFHNAAITQTDLKRFVSCHANCYHGSLAI